MVLVKPINFFIGGSSRQFVTKSELGLPTTKVKACILKSTMQDDDTIHFLSIHSDMHVMEFKGIASQTCSPELVRSEEGEVIGWELSCQTLQALLEQWWGECGLEPDQLPKIKKDHEKLLYLKPNTRSLRVVIADTQPSWDECFAESSFCASKSLFFVLCAL